MPQKQSGRAAIQKAEQKYKSLINAVKLQTDGTEPGRTANRLLNEYLAEAHITELTGAAQVEAWADFAHLGTFKQIATLNSEQSAALLVSGCKLIRRLDDIARGRDEDKAGYAYVALHGVQRAVEAVRPQCKLLSDAQLSEVSVAVARCDNASIAVGADWIARMAERLAKRSPISSKLSKSLSDLADRYDKWTRHRALAARIRKVAGQRDYLPFDTAEAWADRLAQHREFVSHRAAWAALTQHALAARSAVPAARWTKEAERLLCEVEPARFERVMLASLPAVDEPYTKPRVNYFTRYGHADLVLSDASMTVLRGLVWMCAGFPTVEMARLLGRVCESCLRVLPQHGPRAPRVANACLWALAQMKSAASLAELARLRTRIKNQSVLKQLDRVLNSLASRLNVSREELEDQATPTWGFDSNGARVESFGENTASLRIIGNKVVTSWTSDGRAVKSVPAAVKKSYGNEVKALGAAAKDVEKMLVAQRDRIDRMFLERRTWEYATWRQRYIDHPIVGSVARRLIWNFGPGRQSAAALWDKGAWIDALGSAVALPCDDASISLWHPLDHDTKRVLAWRELLERRQIAQPFKQAHREVYLLTDAERYTRTYSNRYAAHVLRQSQLRALCGTRGWTARLIGGWDGGDRAAAEKKISGGLVAEFWYDHAGDDATTDAGAWLYVCSDQLRFYREGETEPLPLEQVPPIVFSEIMRDVDLFVGVASVGNDPTWQDGGPGGRFRDYWQQYSFGELGESAKTRRDVLERLLPRLKIAPRCSLTEKFLVVRGERRTYKIHLGSGNILMEPNDEYLCIVPARGAAAAASGASSDRLFLPFEGDATLSIILSKAFLLADDRTITDPTITRQIESKA